MAKNWAFFPRNEHPKQRGVFKGEKSIRVRKMTTNIVVGIFRHYLPSFAISPMFGHCFTLDRKEFKSTQEFAGFSLIADNVAY